MQNELGGLGTLRRRRVENRHSTEYAMGINPKYGDYWDKNNERRMGTKQSRAKANTGIPFPMWSKDKFRMWRHGSSIQSKLMLRMLSLNCLVMQGKICSHFTEINHYAIIMW